MSTVAQASDGAIIRYATGPVTIAEVTSIGPPKLSADTIDATSHDSGGWKEYIAGLKDGGEVSIEGNFIKTDAGQLALVGDVGADAQGFEIVFPDGPEWAFNAVVTGFEFGGLTPDGKQTFTANFKVSGQPAFTVSASTGLTNPFFAISESAVVAPTASGSVYDYVATVLNGVTSVTVTPTATAGVITVNGNIVATGEASSSITLGAAGSVTVVTVVVTETSKTPKTYTIRVVRAA